MKTWVNVGCIGALLLIGVALVSGHFFDGSKLLSPVVSDSLDTPLPAVEESNDSTLTNNQPSAVDRPPDIQAAGTYDHEYHGGVLVVSQDLSGHETLYASKVLPVRGTEEASERLVEISGPIQWMKGVARYETNETNPPSAINLAFDDTGVTITGTAGQSSDLLGWFTGRWMRRP